MLLYTLLRILAPQPDTPFSPFLLGWIICFLPYFAVCIWIVRTRPLTGNGKWAELAIIFLGTLIFHLQLLSLPAGLSRDAWRYLWDAHATIHGYSPYIYAPGDQILIPLRNILFEQSRYRNLVTNYPPGAQGFFLLGYLLSSTSLLGLKTVFLVCDLATSLALALLLIRKQLDPRKAVIYAWCPLPLVEFAVEGHVDVLVVMFTVLTLLCASSNRSSMRILAGIMLGMATLSKLYPLILLAAVVQRRDWRLMCACALTILLGYVPFLILGHGRALGFFLSFANQQGSNAGPIQLGVRWISYGLQLKEASILSLEHIVDGGVLGGAALLLLFLQNVRRIEPETATLILLGLVVAMLPHVFPWYVTTIVPWIAIALSNTTTEAGGSGKKIAVLAGWSFTCTAVLSYIPAIEALNTTPIWFCYYAFAYGPVLLGVSAAVVMWWLRTRRANLPGANSDGSET
ncbi:glycosyltransferase 87 family protein [Ktedonosporobacter rubrisoli]|nr:glycosyltransferase 87 family protein [Ktedonosporobacter rubrisoli]